MINTAKALLMQYDFKTAIPLGQAVRDYLNPEVDNALRHPYFYAVILCPFTPLLLFLKWRKYGAIK